MVASQRTYGDTRFGEVAIATLRRWYPPAMRAEVELPIGFDVPESGAISVGAEHADIVRFYGVGHPWAFNPSTVGLLLPGNRTFLLSHTRCMCFPRGASVEMWASTGGVSESLATRGFDGDVLPGFVRSFLMNGASGVIDLAWPAHDLVKALVVESFDAVRHLGPLWEPAALVRALRWVADLLAQWRKEAAGFRSKARALHWLDLARASASAEANLDPRAVVPFAPLADAPCLGASVAEMIEEVCQPVHLAAFRWWGA